MRPVSVPVTRPTTVTSLPWENTVGSRNPLYLAMNRPRDRFSPLGLDRESRGRSDTSREVYFSRGLVFRSTPPQVTRAFL